MSLLASLKVLIGADTVDFKRKIAESSQHVNLFENSFGQRSTMVERHGLRLVNTSHSVASAMQRMSFDSTGAITQLADSAGFGKLAMAIGGIAATYGVLNMAVKEAMQGIMTAKAPSIELAEAMSKDKEAFAGAADQLQLLIDHFKLAGPQWQFSREQTFSNAVAIMDLTNRVREEVRARKEASGELLRQQVAQELENEKRAETIRLQGETNKTLRDAKVAQERFNQVHGQFVPAALQVHNALATGREQLRLFADQTRTAFNIWNQDEVIKQAEELKKQFIAVAKSGGSISQTVTAFGGKFEEVVKVAGELGVPLDATFQDIAAGISKGPGLAMEDLFARFKGMPAEVSASRDASKADLEQMGGDLKGTISGGFGEGIKDGINAGKQALDKWRSDLETAGVTIQVTLDTAAVQRQIAMIQSGKFKDTGGYTG